MATSATASLLLVVAAWMSASAPVLAVCRPEYRKRPTHTACQSPAPWCRVVASGVSAAERTLILKIHNDFRSQVAQGRLPGFPAAADMQELLWDDEMADVAQVIIWLLLLAVRFARTLWKLVASLALSWSRWVRFFNGTF